MNNIWKKCPKTQEVMKIEKKAKNFLSKYNLEKDFNISEIEEWIFNCPVNGEKNLFNPILAKMKGNNLKSLIEFDNIFQGMLFPHVPQKVLNGLSPVRYTLLLKRLKE